MPLYEYQCRDCETHFERIERVSAPSDGVCPSCGGRARRLLGAPALQFKGSGWYVNDYGKGHGNPPPPTGESATESTGESKTEAKTEAKTETATKTETPAKTETTPKNDSKVA